MFDKDMSYEQLFTIHVPKEVTFTGSDSIGALHAAKLEVPRSRPATRPAA